MSTQSTQPLFDWPGGHLIALVVRHGNDLPVNLHLDKDTGPQGSLRPLFFSRWRDLSHVHLNKKKRPHKQLSRWGPAWYGSYFMIFHSTSS